MSSDTGPEITPLSVAHFGFPEGAHVLNANKITRKIHDLNLEVQRELQEQTYTGEPLQKKRVVSEAIARIVHRMVEKNPDYVIPTVLPLGKDSQGERIEPDCKDISLITWVLANKHGLDQTCLMRLKFPDSYHLTVYEPELGIIEGRTGEVIDFDQYIGRYSIDAEGTLWMGRLYPAKEFSLSLGIREEDIQAMMNAMSKISPVEVKHLIFFEQCPVEDLLFIRNISKRDHQIS